MAKTQLNLKLFYKGKLLDAAKFDRDFKRKLVIGTDKYLFWQILDSSFPEKFEVISKKGEQYHLNISSKMQFAYDTDGAQKISGKEIVLTSDKSGKLSIGNDWVISYEFAEPWVKVLTEEERQIVHQYSRRAELGPFEKFTRNFLIAATGLTIICIVIFDTFKPEKVEVTSLEQYTQNIEAVATKVEVNAKDLGADYEEQKAPEVVKETPKESKVNAPGGANSGTMSKEAAKNALKGLLGAGGFQPGATGQAMNFAVTTEEDIVASSMGGGKGGGGGGKGPGKGGASSIAGGAGFGSVFDPTAVSGGTTNLAGLSSGRPKGNLSTNNPGGTVATFVGDAGRLAPVGKPSTKVSSGILSRFSGPTVKKVSEGNFSAAPAEIRPELQRIEQRVARYKPQIKDLFNRLSQVKSMYGSIRFTLYIDTNGSVAGVTITPMSGEFYPEFLSQLEQVVRGWKFDNKNMVPYEFLMTFTK